MPGILVLLVSSLLAFTATARGQTDLALNRPVTADSIQGAGFEAAKANDGNATTRWSSNYSGGTHSIYVDLGSTVTVTRVTLNWEGAYGKDYTIQTSTNATSWTTVVTVTGNASAGVKDYTGLSASGRYVRVNCTLPSQWGNISLWDFSVFGSGGGSAPLPNGTYTLAPANATGLRLDVAGAGSANGTNVDAVSSNGGTNQQWIFTNVSGNVYRVSPVHASAQCLDVSGQATASGTNVQIWQFLSQANQQWAVTAVSGGYTLAPTHATGLRLNNTGTATGSNVNVTTANSSTAQTWAIVAAGGGGGAPAAPSGLSASAGNAQVSLSWNASSGATSYSVFRGTSANGESTTAIASNIAGTTYTNTGLTNGTTYFYKVKGVNSVGSSGYSNEASATPAAGGAETIGGGTMTSPAVGPAPSYPGSVGTGYTLVKNWNFGTNGTIKNYTDMNQEFVYKNVWGGLGNDIGYGSVIVAPDLAHVAYSGAPVEGTNTGGNPVRQFTVDSLKTFLVPINGATTMDPSYPNNVITTGNGSFMASWSLANGGSLLGKDIVWETRIRMVTPPYYWFAIWSSATAWDNGAEMDVVEGFGYDNTPQGGGTNYNGAYWHSNSVGGTDSFKPNFINDWGGTMASVGITNYDATQYHIFQWVYRKNNTYDVYMDGIRCQGGTINWTTGATSGGTPADMHFMFDGAWGHNRTQSVNHTLPASALVGKYYEWDYSRVYLRN